MAECHKPHTAPANPSLLALCIKKMIPEYKDIVSVDLPHICGDPIVSITFSLNSEYITLSIPQNRIYNLNNIEIIQRDEGYVKIKCTNQSIIYIFSNFDLIHNVYFYPFISSVFTLDSLKIESEHDPRLEISIPSEFKSLSFLSFVQDPFDKRHIKQFETWTDKKGTFYYQLFEECCFQFSLRATGRGINYGLMHLILPLTMFALGFFLLYGNLPAAVTDNSSSILFAVLVTFTPVYLGVLQDYLSKSFMSLSLGLALYAKSYIVSVLYILIFTFSPKLILWFVLLELCWTLVFLKGVRGYFNTGRFGQYIEKVFFKPIIYLMQRRYRKAWKSQSIK